MNNNILHVIWVEDNTNIYEHVSLLADSYNIQLHPFDNWDDAKNQLCSSYNKWDAIILDAKCKLNKDSSDNAFRFLTQVFSELSTLRERNHHLIPWFVLSGGGAEIPQLNDLVNEDRLTWDSEWNKTSYYSKGKDEATLFERIYSIAKKSETYQIKSCLYPDVFNAIEDTNLNEEVESIMFNLLMPIHFGNFSNELYNKEFISARKVIEYVYRSMINHGLLPKELKTNKAGKEVVNMSWCTKLLKYGELNETTLKVKYCFKVYTKVMANIVRDILDLTNSFVHSQCEDNDPYDEYNSYHHLKEVDGSPYYLRMIAMGLCDFLIWYGKFYKEHICYEKNIDLWEINYSALQAQCKEGK